jgi:hypothetical protein
MYNKQQLQEVIGRKLSGTGWNGGKKFLNIYFKIWKIRNCALNKEKRQKKKLTNIKKNACFYFKAISTAFKNNFHTLFF